MKLAFAAFFALSAAAMAAEPGQDPERQPAIIKARVDVVNILATVRDRRGGYVTDLSKDDFSVTEDKVPQEIDFFSFESGENAQPLTIALLIDTSGSVKDKLLFEKQAAMEFFRTTIRSDKDLASIVQFDSDINLVQDFTSDLEILASSLNTVRAGGATKLYDAIYLGTEELLRHQIGRRVMVVLSDGRDTNSDVSQHEAIRTAQLRDVLIFGVGVKSPGSSPDFGVLKDFARSTGGEFYQSKIDLQRLRAAFRKINDEIKNQYSIGYISKNTRRDGSFRSIQIKVKKRGLKVSHRKGYFAPQPIQGGS